MNLNLIMSSTFSLKTIYQLRKTSLSLTILISLVIGVLHFTPHTLAFFSLEPYIRHMEQIWQITPKMQENLIQILPSQCFIQDFHLSCDEVMTFYINADFGILVNHEDIELQNGLIFMADYFIFVGNGIRKEFSYYYLEGLDFQYLQNDSHGYNVLMNRSAYALRRIWIIPFIFGSYLTGIVSYLGYIVTVSALSMLLKFGHASFLKYKEVLNILVFSSIPIVVVMILIGFIIPAFTILFFNLATPIVAWFVYKKYVIPDLEKTTNKTKELVKGSQG